MTAVPSSTAVDTSTGAGGPLAAASARSLLVTVLGELVWPTGGPVWTATLVRILQTLDVEEQTARQAIARAAASGWIEPRRQGREVRWTLTSDLVGVFETGARRVEALAEPFTDWDGTWLTAAVTVPSSLRSSRRPLYAGLTWAGFGNPTPGLWLSPHVERVDEVRRLVVELDLARHTICVAGRLDETVGLSEAEVVAQGWDLAALSDHYADVLEAVQRLKPRGEDARLAAHLRMLSTYRAFPRTDPQLPEALLPDWIGRRVARVIEAQRRRWLPEVARRFAEIDAEAGA